MLINNVIVKASRYSRQLVVKSFGRVKSYMHMFNSAWGFSGPNHHIVQGSTVQ